MILHCLSSFNSTRLPAIFALISIALLLFSCSHNGVDQALDEPVSRPNVILIVADDLGYSDLGVYGSEIDTPNIDALARNGITFTNFHSNATCTPSRAMLVTGRDNHSVGFGVNPGVANRFPLLKGKPGYVGEFGADTMSLASRFKMAGFDTFFAGKWHLGKTPASAPPKQGYSRSFYLEDGGASHFSDGMGTLENESPASYFVNAEQINKLPGDFFSSTFFTDQIISYIDSTRQSDNDPFFAHLAFTAPHWPLQVPDKWIDKYRGQYDGGWLEVRAQRLKNMVALEHFDSDMAIAPLPEALGNWGQLTEYEAQVESRRMEIYAAMISHMDHEVGRLINFLKDNDLYDNTVIVFVSDNGPEGNDVLKIRNNATWVPENFDLSLDAMGKPGSYVTLGRGWAHVSASPFRLYKSFLSEGGSRVPLIIKSEKNQQRAKRSNELISMIDLAPTLLDFAGIPNNASYPMLGESYAAVFEENKSPIKRRQPFSIEMYGGRAIYQDDWKLLWIGTPVGSSRWQLYNLRSDPGEQSDLADQYPDVVARMSQAWDKYAVENKVQPVERDFGYGRYADMEKGP